MLTGIAAFILLFHGAAASEPGYAILLGWGGIFLLRDGWRMWKERVFWIE